MRLGRGRNAQKLIFQPISRHPKFRVTDLQTFRPSDTASYRVAQPATKNGTDFLPYQMMHLRLFFSLSVDVPTSVFKRVEILVSFLPNASSRSSAYALLSFCEPSSMSLITQSLVYYQNQHIKDFSSVTYLQLSTQSVKV